MKKNHELSNLRVAQYAFLALPLAYCGLPLYIHAPDYYVTQFGFSLSAIGFVLLIVRLFDAIQDPVIGYILDKYRQSSIIIAGVSIVLLAIGFFLLYAPFGFQSLLWFGLMLGMSTTAYSILSIHLNAQGSLWSEDENSKTIITSTREIFGLVGLLIATILPTVFMQYFSVQNSFLLYATVFLVFILCAGFSFLNWSKTVSLKKRDGDSLSLRTFESIKSLFKFKNMRFFLSTYFFSTLASSFPAVLIIFFVRDNLMLEEYTGAFLLVYFLCAIISIPLWKKISKNIQREKIWLFAMALSIFSFLWAFTLGGGDMIPFLLICVCTGFALGAELSLPPAILSSIIDKAQLQETTSIIFSVIAFIGKISLTLATSLSFFVLDLYDFKPAEDNTQTSLVALSFMYAFLPCVLKLVSCFLMFQWLRGIDINDKNFKTDNSNGSYNNV